MGENFFWPPRPGGKQKKKLDKTKKFFLGEKKFFGNIL